MANLTHSPKTSRATKSYLVVPGVLLAAFLVFQLDFKRKRDLREAAVAAELAAAKQADEEARAGRQRLAAADAARRAEERTQREREREEAKRREFEALLDRIESQAATHEQRAAALAASVTAAEQRLADLRANRDRTSRDAFDLARTVEQQRIERRTAELELQRTTRMILARVLEE